MTDGIHLAAAPADFVAFAGLITEYVVWCRERYREHPWFVDQVFGHQSLSAELGGLGAAYSSPRGRALLYVGEGQIRGCGAYRRRDDGSCEMKRLFVPDRFKGQGIGRKLCSALIAAAQDEGFELMRLDTANLMTEAIGLYRSFGFRECSPYLEYPHELMRYLVFMELSLAAR